MDRIVKAALAYYKEYGSVGYAPRNLNISPKRAALFKACEAMAKGK